MQLADSFSEELRTVRAFLFSLRPRHFGGIMGIMLALSVNAHTPRAIAAAFEKIHGMVCAGTLGADEPVRVVLAPGQYHEILAYNLANPLVMESVPGTAAQDCVVSAENCERFHKDTENRAVFVIGPKATKVTLRGFTVENTHVKTDDDAALGNQAEALCWHNGGGILLAERMRFVSRQDTVHVKGVSWFRDCFVCGDVDFIWGYCDVSLWERCHIHVRQDNRGDGRDAYVLQSRALNGKPGFVLSGCTFTADVRGNGAHIYVARSSGTGRSDSPDRWDSVVLINCTVSPEYDVSLWTDEGGSRAVYPAGSAAVGWREYGTKSPGKDGVPVAADTGRRSPHGYVLSDQEYRAGYADSSHILGAYAARYAQWEKEAR